MRWIQLKQTQHGKNNGPPPDMNIDLKNVIPVPLAGTSFNSESVWGNNITLSSENNYLINAPSGTGKSTLIATLFGTRNDFSGDILIDNINSRDISLRQWSELRRKSLAVVFQDLRLFPELTAYDNIAIKAGLTSTTFREEISSHAEKLGIIDQMNVQCKFLSLGQQQRVAILRGLAQPFNFLLLDEPFSHLDERNIELASEIINKVCKKHNAGLLLTSLGEKYFFNYQRTLTI
jgi:putative ABC transport system ATP-binding protein